MVASTPQAARSYLSLTCEQTPKETWEHILAVRTKTRAFKGQDAEKSWGLIRASKS